MTNLKGKRILVVDDEEDILETVKDILDDVNIDTANNYDDASRKIAKKNYDMAVLDIMGVNGLQLLSEAVNRGIPTVMLTAHAISEETLMKSIKKGAISYLPKESLAELDTFLSELLNAYEKGEPPWKLLFERLGGYFNKRFGKDWKDKNSGFWSEFDKTYLIGRGIGARLQSDPDIIGKGI